MQTILDLIAQRCTEVDSGARNVDHIVTHTLLPELSTLVLNRVAQAKPFSRAHLKVDDSGDFVYDFP